MKAAEAEAALRPRQQPTTIKASRPDRGTRICPVVFIAILPSLGSAAPSHLGAEPANLTLLIPEPLGIAAALALHLREEQRRQLLVVDAGGLAVRAPLDERRERAGDPLGDEAELALAGAALVAVAHRVERQQPAGGRPPERVDVALERARGGGRGAELAVGVDQDAVGRAGDRCAADAGEECRDLRPCGADPDGATLPRDTGIGDVDVVRAGRQVLPGAGAERDVEGAGGVRDERLVARRGVVAAGGVGGEGARPGAE